MRYAGKTKADVEEKLDRIRSEEETCMLSVQIVKGEIQFITIGDGIEVPIGQG